jgi:phage terminase small subunit
MTAATPEIAANPLQNAKHEAVLQHYFSDAERIGWRCYQRVYPNSSQRASETGFSRLLKSAEFSARLAWLQRSAADDNVMSLNEVLVELTKLGRSNIQNVVVSDFNTGEVVKSLYDMAPEHAATIQELTIETYTEGQGESARDVKRVKVKLHGKHAPLAELRRHYEPDKHADPDGRPLGTGAALAAVEAVSDLEAARRVAFLLERAARGKAAPAAPKPAAKAAPKKGKTK